MKEPTFLLAVHRIVGGIEINRDLAGGRARAHPGTDRQTAF
jgi:hypothetical protein